MCVWLFVQTTLIQTINVCITLSILRAHIYIKIALRMLTIFASIPIIQSRHHYNFFFREDEAISLFFKNSSMSCKKLNNIWYCRLLFWKSRTSQKKIYLNFLDQQLSKDCDCYKSFCQTTSIFLSFIVFLWYVLFIISPIWTKRFSFICNLAAPQPTLGHCERQPH